jgi:hypothetical protein
MELLSRWLSSLEFKLELRQGVSNVDAYPKTAQESGLAHFAYR